LILVQLTLVAGLMETMIVSALKIYLIGRNFYIKKNAISN